MSHWASFVFLLFDAGEVIEAELQVVLNTLTSRTHFKKWQKRWDWCILWGQWWSEGPKLVFVQMAASVSWEEATTNCSFLDTGKTEQRSCVSTHRVLICPCQAVTGRCFWTKLTATRGVILPTWRALHFWNPCVTWLKQPTGSPLPVCTIPALKCYLILGWDWTVPHDKPNVTPQSHMHWHLRFPQQWPWRLLTSWVWPMYISRQKCFGWRQFLHHHSKPWEQGQHILPKY
jgi:hypothetical protein